MKFKVGDRVRVRKGLVDGQEYDGQKFMGDMKKFIGEIVTIESVYSDYYHIKEENNEYNSCLWSWRWTDNMFESKIINFTKSDLKDGMVVEYRDGGRALVLGGWLFDETSCLLIENFNDNFENCYDGKNSVDKVYTSNAPSLSEYFDNNMLKLIWKRNPVKKMTIAEIEKELGYKIEIVSDKEE